MQTAAKATQALILAVIRKNPSTAARALAAKANPNARFYGTPLLHVAVESGIVPLVRLLLKAGADPRTRHDGNGVLSRVTARKSAGPMVRQLLDSGATPAGPDLFALAVRGFRAEAKSLLARGVSLEGLLHRAAEYPSLTAARILVALGADPSKKKGGKTPLEVAKERDHNAIARFLASRTGVPFHASPEALADKLGAQTARWAIEGDDWDEAKRQKLDPWDLAPAEWTSAAGRSVAQAVTAAGLKGKAREARIGECFARFLAAFEAEARRRGKRPR